MNSKEPQDYGLDWQNAKDNRAKNSQISSSLPNAPIGHSPELSLPELASIELHQYIYQETTAAICIVEVLAEGEYLYVDSNPMCEARRVAITGNWKGKSPQEVFTRKDLQIVLQAYRDCVRSQQIVSYRNYVVVGNHRSCWITTVKPKIDNDGKVYRLISTSVNITIEEEVEQHTFQLRSALAQLQQALQSEELVRSITQSIRDTLDERQVLQTATKSLTEGLKVDCCQIELYKYQHTVTEVICEYPIVLPDAQGIHRQVADYPELYDRLLNKQSVHFVDWLPTVGFRQQQVTRLVCPILDDRGILGNLWLMRPKESLFEPGEIKLVEQIADQCAIAIRQARLYNAEQLQVKELEKLNVIKDDFLKTISHELRTPMSRLRLAISTLENLLDVEVGAHNSARIDKVMAIFHDSFKKQNQLIDDLLTLCYVDTASKPDLWQSIDLQAWIPRIVKTFSFDVNRQELQLDLATGLPLLHSDTKMLKRIVQELLKNAYKYTPEDGTITISTEKTLTQLLLKVTNTGVEIPVEEQENIFARFYRIPNNDPWQHGGTGIGLALVKKLVELLEGEITVSSYHQTTTFTVTFALN